MTRINWKLSKCHLFYNVLLNVNKSQNVQNIIESTSHQPLRMIMMINRSTLREQRQSDNKYVMFWEIIQLVPTRREFIDWISYKNIWNQIKKSENKTMMIMILLVKIILIERIMIKLMLVKRMMIRMMIRMIFV